MDKQPIFDHEKLDVYRLSIEFQAWVGDLLDDGFGKRAKPSAAKHLDEASTSISNNIAEGNGKRSYIDRARFVDIACGSGLECAACIDALVARKLLEQQRAKTGKLMLHRIVSMLHKLRDKLSAHESKTYSRSSTSTSTAGAEHEHDGEFANSP
jgi:four helix bundle protein